MLRVLSFVALLLNGCGRGDESVVIEGRKYGLLPKTKAVPVDLNNVEMVGYCSTEEKLEIANCLGRIPLAGLLVSRITVVWPAERVAAEVVLGRTGNRRTTLFLVKNRDGSWEVRGSASVVH
jgi:hypothetical protein